MKLSHTVIIIATLGLCGCKIPNGIISGSQTVIGVTIQENPATQLYEAKGGFVRNEFAYVPGNTNCPSSFPDVIMELRVNNLLAGGMIYQRLAVGTAACSQPGASLMFAKDVSGGLGTNFFQQVGLLKLIAPQK